MHSGKVKLDVHISLVLQKTWKCIK